jgi:hypothetical protein
VIDHGNAGGDAVGGGNDEAAPLHGARQTLTQGSVVVDDQEAAITVGERRERYWSRIGRGWCGIVHGFLS